MADFQQIVDEVRNRTDIVEVVGNYVELKKAGRNYKGLCPFHEEKTPSFMVSPDKQIFHCFGCHKGGNVFTFLMEIDHLSFPEALRILAEETGVELPQQNPSAVNNDQYERIYQALNVAQTYFKNALNQHWQAVKPYLQQRKVGNDLVEEFGIGYAPEAWQGLLQYAQKSGISESVLEEAGLINTSQNGKRFDRFRQRLMFPIWSARQQILGFGGRIFGEAPADAPKYLNSPETSVFLKKRELYGFWKAKEAIRKTEHIVIVEGYFDVLRLHQFGFSTAVATMGTALTEDHMRLLKRMIRKVYFCFDMDAAGQKAAHRSLEMALQFGLEPYFVQLPGGEDPDSFLLQQGRDAFRERIDQAQNFIQFSLQKSGQGFAEKRKQVELLIELLHRMPDTPARSFYVQAAAKALQMQTEEIQRFLKQPLKQKSTPTKPVGSESFSWQPEAEQEIVKIALQHPALREEILEKISLEDLTNETIKCIFEIWTHDPQTDIIDWYHEQGDAVMLSRISQLQLQHSEPDRIDKWIAHIHIRSLRSDMEAIEQQLALPESNMRILLEALEKKRMEIARLQNEYSI